VRRAQLSVGIFAPAVYVHTNAQTLEILRKDSHLFLDNVTWWALLVLILGL
jgi:hypothetical protein